MAQARPAAGHARVGRDGALRIALERRGARTVVAACRWTLPLQVLAPMALDDPALVLSVLNPTGGLVGGDRLEVEVAAGAGTHACLTTPSATKIYRSDGPVAEQTVRLTLARDARVEWVPDHAIPFPGAAFRQRIEAEVAEGAALILVDAFAAGRVARGEAWRFARFDSGLTVRDAGGWLLHDRLALDASLGAAALGMAERRPYVATIVVIADRGVEPFARAVDALGVPDAEVGAGLLPRRGALVRCLAGSAPALQRAVDDVWAAGRRCLLDLAPLGLRKP